MVAIIRVLLGLTEKNIRFIVKIYTNFLAHILGGSLTSPVFITHSKEKCLVGELRQQLR